MPAAFIEVLPMHDVQSFGGVVLAWGLVGTAALLAHRIARLIRIPAPAQFLIAAAVASTYLKSVRHAVDLRHAEDIVTLALVVILFDGGLHLGRRRFREAAVPIVLLGVAGTFATTALLAVLAHVAFGLDWKSSLVLGAALAPTDPAVVFGILAKEPLRGRASAILEGESGFNDPAGIALLLGFVHLATHPSASIAGMVFTFVSSMVVGSVLGLLGGLVLGRVIRAPLLSGTPQQSLCAVAGVLSLYGLTTIAHGSGFLAVLVAGIVMRDGPASLDSPFEQFQATLAGLAEIVAFVVLGLTVQLHALGPGHAWLIGVGTFAILTLIARPLVCIPLLAFVRISRRETTFIAWSGLKGAVPLLLGALAVSGGAPDAPRLYAIVFVVVVLSVVSQGGTLAWVARRLGLNGREPGLEERGGS